jgi:hypothetical protein
MRNVEGSRAKKFTKVDVYAYPIDGSDLKTYNTRDIVGKSRSDTENTHKVQSQSNAED